MADVYRQEFGKWMRQQRNYWHDRGDKRQDPRFQAIYKRLEDTENMAQSDRGLRTLHDEIRTTQRLIMQAQNSGNPITSAEHSQELYHNLERRANELRHHPHFK